MRQLAGTFQFVGVQTSACDSLGLVAIGGGRQKPVLQRVLPLHRRCHVMNNPESKTRRWWNRRTKSLAWIALGVLLPLCYLTWHIFGWPASIRISYETTRLTSPLTADGHCAFEPTALAAGLMMVVFLQLAPRRKRVRLSTWKIENDFRGGNHLMDNPYEAPATRPLSNESRRDLWQRQLTCPHCGEPGISAGAAYLAHPFLKVRCSSCGGRSWVKLTGAARKRFVALSWTATTLIASAIGVMAFVDPFSIYRLIDNATPWVWESFNVANQLLVVHIGILSIAVIPLLAVLYVSATLSLRDIAYFSTLIAANKPQT